MLQAGYVRLLCCLVRAWEGFLPLDEIFTDVLCFCHAGKLYYTEDRIDLDEEEGLQQGKEIIFSACG